MLSALSALTGANVASGDRITLLDVSDTTHGAGGTAKTITAEELKNGYVHGAGSAAAGSWPVLGVGTVLATAEDGAIEQDADVFYHTTDAGNRGYVPARHCIRADATRTLPNNTSENAIFNSPTNGRITLETGTYLFNGMLSVNTMSATSGNAAIDLLGAGTATASAWLWHAVGVDGNTATAATQTGSTTVTQQSAASIVTAGTGTVLNVSMRGTFEVTGAGTLIPSITLVTASAAVVAIGSYICLERIGSTSLVSIGQWD